MPRQYFTKQSNSLNTHDHFLKLGACTNRLAPTQSTDADNTAPLLEPTDGAEAGEQRGTPVPKPVRYRSQNASLKPNQKTEPTDNLKKKKKKKKATFYAQP